MLRDRHADPNPDADYSDRARHAQPTMDKASPAATNDRKRRDASFMSR